MEGYHATIGSAKASARRRRIREDTFKSEETFDHGLAVDEQYGYRESKPVSRFFGQAAEGNGPVAWPSRVNDNGAF